MASILVPLLSALLAAPAAAAVTSLGPALDEQFEAAAAAAKKKPIGTYGSCPVEVAANEEGPIYFPGDPVQAPDIKLKDTAGKDGKLWALRGSVVVVEFMATWCGPCRAASADLQELHQAYFERGAFVFAVSVKETRDAVAAYETAAGIAYPILLDTDGAAAAAYHVRGTPTFVVIDQDGKEAWRVEGWTPQTKKRLSDAIDRVLARKEKSL